MVPLPLQGRLEECILSLACKERWHGFSRDGEVSPYNCRELEHSRYTKVKIDPVKIDFRARINKLCFWPLRMVKYKYTAYPSFVFDIILPQFKYAVKRTFCRGGIMLNYLWGGFILAGIMAAAFTGNMHNVTTGVIDQAKEAVTTCITMLGVLSMWTGLMNIAQKSGLTKRMTKGLMPMLRLLFPDIPKDNAAYEHIGNNVVANILGLGWASTPAGLYAMEELDKLNGHRESASDMMCDFMIFNMSSLQIISVNMIAYRSQYNSQNPSEIIGAGLFATLVSTVVSVLFIFIRRHTAGRRGIK